MNVITKELAAATEKNSTSAVKTTIRFAIGECALGSILVAQSGRGVCAILLGDNRDELVRDLRDRFPHTHERTR